MSSPFNADDRSATTAKTQSFYKELSAAASRLNHASDEFGGAAAEVDLALSNLNIGVAAWVKVCGGSDAERPWESTEERLGYDKVNGRWGLCLSIVQVDSNNDTEEITASWLFNDAPRKTRLRAIEFVPELIAKLTKEVKRTADSVSEKALVARELAAAINTIALGDSEKGGRR
jgi:hypothetical protein